MSYDPTVLRWVLATALVGVGCAPSDVLYVPAPPNTQVSLYVDLQRAPAVAWVFDETHAERTIEPPQAAAVLHYDRSLDELGLTAKDGAIVTTSDSRPETSRGLPLPSTWVELEGTEPTPRTVDPIAFAGRFQQLRVPRRSCSRFASPAPEARRQLQGSLAFAIPFGRDAIMVGSFATSTVTRPAFRVVSRTEDFELPGVAPEGEFVAGFALPDGRAQVLYTDARGQQTCEITRESVGAPRCWPTLIAGSGFEPLVTAGHLTDGRYEAVAIDRLRRLWFTREGEPWRLIVTDEPRAMGCRVLAAVPLLRFDGPGRGIAAMPWGRLLSFDVGADGRTRVTSLIEQEPDATYCRSNYGRYPDGNELVFLADDNSARTRVLWRRSPTDRWTAPSNVPPVVVRALISYDRALLLAAVTPELHTIEIDPDKVGEGPLDCFALNVGFYPGELVALPDGHVVVFSGTTADAPYDVTWLEPL